MFIFPQIKYRGYFVSDGAQYCFSVVNSSGWLTGIEFRLFIKHFIDNMKPSPFDSMLLLLKNHSSYFDIDVVEMAKGKM